MILLNKLKEIIILERGIKYIIHQDAIKIDFILIQQIQISQLNIKLNGKGSGQVKLAAAFAYGGSN